MIKPLNKSGFTILELLIATTVFSVILLIVTTGIIKVGNIYYKGIISSKTQDSIRSISNDLSSTIQFANGIKTDALNPPADQKIFCMGDVRYVYFPNKIFKKDGANDEFNSGLYSEDLASGSKCVVSSTTQCAGLTTIDCYKERRQLLGKNMRVLTLNVAKVGSTDNLWAINAKLAYGDDDLLTNDGNPDISPATLAGVTCKSGISGSSFCSVAQLDTIVKKRLQ